MKKYVFVVIVVIGLLSIIACGEKKSSNVTFENAEAVDDTPRDSTIYGICSDGSAMNTLQLITDNGDTLTLSTMEAQEADRLFGGYSVGDYMAVFTDQARTKAEMIVNLTVLFGDWVMTNSTNGTSRMGFCIRDSGIVESINQPASIYETWRLVNGNLELVSRCDGDLEKVERYQLLFLSSDSLAYCNEEGIYEYSRSQQ